MSPLFGKTSKYAALVLLCLGFANPALAEHFDGTWILADTQGKPFEVTLSKEGNAEGTHSPSMKQGTWKEENGVAVIRWNTGWITLISKQGDQFVKSAFKPGAPITGQPTNTSTAIKK